MKKLLIVIFLSLSTNCFGTHLHAGDLTFRDLGGNSVEFRVTLYCDTSSTADSTIVLWYGDSTHDTVVVSSMQNMLDSNIVMKIFFKTHVYNSNGDYHVRCEVQNRVANISNIPNSSATGMCLSAYLNLNPFLGTNDSPIFGMHAMDKGIVNHPYVYSSAVIEADGDSLSYELAECLNYDCDTIVGYSFPVTSNIFRIDSLTGIITWDSPLVEGYWNVRMIIREFRFGDEIGYVTRDLQFIIESGIGISELDPNSSATFVYPNPTYNEIYIQQLPGSIRYDGFKIFTLTGQMIFSGKLEKQSISLKDLACGVYILSLLNDNQTENFRVVRK